MNHKNKTILSFLLGSIFAFLIIYFWKGVNKNEAAQINKDYYIITNQISKMNKMVVLEQDFSSFQTHRSSAFKVGGYDILPKEMVLYSTAKAQVSYDLKQMKLEVDSIDKKLIIKELPNAEIKIMPDVKIHFMDDYAINRFSQSDLNGIMEAAKQNMVKSVDQRKLREEGRKQLITNLNEIFVLAKALNYTIEDETRQVILQ
ncbi:MAG: DUF4230 domain-containing protein [Cloacibacterium sp.]|nr:DUF4230 domain-containing protein [Cloacibacterium sp.]